MCRDRVFPKSCQLRKLHGATFYSTKASVLLLGRDCMWFQSFQRNLRQPSLPLTPFTRKPQVFPHRHRLQLTPCRQRHLLFPPHRRNPSPTSRLHNLQWQRFLLAPPRQVGRSYFSCFCLIQLYKMLVNILNSSQLKSILCPVLGLRSNVKVKEAYLFGDGGNENGK